MHQLAGAVLLAASVTVADPVVLQQLASCRTAGCLEDAFFTLHAPSRPVKFFYHARALQLHQRNRASEAAILTTIPRDERDAKALLALADVPIKGRRATERRDAICERMPDIYWDAAARHPEALPRLLKAADWMGPRFQRIVRERCADRPDLCH